MFIIFSYLKKECKSIFKYTIGVFKFDYRNTATELIKQELVFVGGEHGKLMAVRDIFNKVRYSSYL